MSRSQKEPALHKTLINKGDTSGGAAAGLGGLSCPPWPPTCTYREQVLAFWFQVGYNVLQPLPGPLGEAALIVRQLGDSRPRGFTGCPQGPKDTKKLVNLRVTRKQGCASHLERRRGGGVGSTPLSFRSQYQIRGQTRGTFKLLSQGRGKNPGLSGTEPASSVP